MHSEIDHLFASFASWIALSGFIYFALTLDSEEAEARKKNEKKIKEEAQKKNGNR